jgi:tumor protein p53-inducible protein 3
MTEFEGKLMGYFRNGDIKPIIDREFDLDQIQEAHRLMESNANTGKILIKVFDQQETKERTDL